MGVDGSPAPGGATSGDEGARERAESSERDSDGGSSGTVGLASAGGGGAVTTTGGATAVTGFGVSVLNLAEAACGRGGSVRGVPG